MKIGQEAALEHEVAGVGQWGPGENRQQKRQQERGIRSRAPGVTVGWCIMRKRSIVYVSKPGQSTRSSRTRSAVPGDRERAMGGLVQEEGGMRNLTVCRDGGFSQRPLRRRPSARCSSRPDTVVWLDIEAPDDAEIRLLRDEFGFHPLAIEDATRAHERPKVDAYEHAVLLHPTGPRTRREIPEPENGEAWPSGLLLHRLLRGPSSTQRTTRASEAINLFVGRNISSRSTGRHAARPGDTCALADARQPAGQYGRGAGSRVPRRYRGRLFPADGPSWRTGWRNSRTRSSSITAKKRSKASLR